MRNTEKMRLFYQRCGNWREVASRTSEEYARFDEIGPRADYYGLALGSSTMESATAGQDCFAAALWRADDISFWHEDRACEEIPDREPIVMKDGELTWHGAKIIFWHMVNTKRVRYFTWPFRSYDSICDYMIDDAGVYDGKAMKYRRRIRVSRILRFYMRACFRKFSRALRRIIPGRIR